MGHHHRSVPCPAHAAAGSLAAIMMLGVAGAMSAHESGLAAAREARDNHVATLWQQRLVRARSSASEALSVARAAVDKVRDLEEEVAAMRRAVASRDALIRSLSANAA